jgi:hypothetical protein
MKTFFLRLGVLKFLNFVHINLFVKSKIVIEEKQSRRKVWIDEPGTIREIAESRPLISN